MEPIAGAGAISVVDMIGRILCAMLIGIVVGTERGRHRPAGMRTHMLVALGACVVMITGNLLFEFRQLGATPDPARLGAQVISGVGFLGAGTIMREGLTIKGLTTAASVWAVACLGLAAGAGYYALALTGAAAVYVTLTVFETVQRKFNLEQRAKLLITLECSDIEHIVHAINRFAVQQNAKATQTQFDETGKNSYSMTVTVSFHGVHVENDQALFLEKLSACEGVRHLDSTAY